MFNKGYQVSTWLHSDRKRATPAYLQKKTAEPFHCCQATFSTLDYPVVSWGTLSSDFLLWKLHMSYAWPSAFCLLFLLAWWAIDGYTGQRCVFFIPSCHNALWPKGSPPEGDWEDCTWSSERRVGKRKEGKPTAGQGTPNHSCSSSEEVSAEGKILNTSCLEREEK